MRCAWALCLFLALSWPCRAGNGDANLDGVVDFADAAAALRFVAGLDIPAFGARVAADVPKYRNFDGLLAPDGLVTIGDAVEIARLAARVERPLPTHLLSTAVALRAHGDVTLNVAMEAGYQVSGHVTDAHGNPFTGRLVFGRYVIWDQGPSAAYAANDVAGAYSITLPASWYTLTPAVETFTTTPLGGVTRVSIALRYVGSSPVYDIGADSDMLDVLVQGLPLELYAASVSTKTAAGASYTSREIHLGSTSDNGTGLWGAHRIVAPDSGTWSIPAATYPVRFVGETTLSDGTVQPWTYYVDRYTVPNTLPLVPVMGPFVELSGTVTPPAGFTMRMVQLLGVDAIPAFPSTVYKPNPQKVLATLPVGPDGSYRIAGMTERYAVVFTATSPEFTAKYTALYRFGTDPATWNVRMPQAQAARTVSGQVFGPDGRPVANVPVEISYPPYSGLTYSTATVTDAQGRYSARIPNGTYTLSVTP